MYGKLSFSFCEKKFFFDSASKKAGETPTYSSTETPVMLLESLQNLQLIWASLFGRNSNIPYCNVVVSIFFSNKP